MNNHLNDIVKKHKSGKHSGIYSVCSSNDWVLRSTMRLAGQQGATVLIESTANQVNQFGGYTGMRPRDFVQHVHELALEYKLPLERVILGGDHLGPVVWANEPEEISMQKARDLVKEYVCAGYQKIHIDTSMKLQDDDLSVPLSDKIIAKRAAELFEAAFNTLIENKIAEDKWPSFVIGSEVPIPGGAQEKELEVQVTTPEHFEATVQNFRIALHEKKLDCLWDHIMAVVVQPGVEFSDTQVKPYDEKEAAQLVCALKNYHNLVFEGHSTDYQSEHSLRKMVDDGICVLKVGPALTFALKEALLALDMIESEWYNISNREPTGLRCRLEALMCDNPSYWERYYKGTEKEKRFKLFYSLSDRIRYYLPLPEAQRAIDQLIKNLRSEDIPLSLISQYLPVQAAKLREGTIIYDPEELILDHIGEVLLTYQRAISAAP